MAVDNKIELDEKARLTRLEAGFDSFSMTVREDISRLTADIHTIVEELRRRDKTPWGILASWAGIIITIVLLFGAPIWQGLNRIDSRQGEFTALFRNHISDGHPASVTQQIRALRGEVIHRLGQLEASRKRDEDYNSKILRDMLRDGYRGWMTRTKPGS